MVAVVVLTACADLERGGPLPDAAVAAVDAASPTSDAPPGDAVAALTYARDVRPLLVAACAGCHSETGQASRSGFIMGRDASDHANVATFINPTEPARSRLLVKGAGAGHEGGAAVRTGTPEYLTILAWITQGGLP
jgi:mono/diheme cytochrome c family protein